jgi:hypothetical protein
MAVIGSTLGQVSLNTVSANIGAIRTFLPAHSPFQAYQYSVYPEIQAGGEFFTPSVVWSTYWGYWTDGVARAFPIADYVTYSHASHIVGARFQFSPARILPHWPIPIGIFTGVAHHFITATYIGGFAYDGRPGHDFTADATTLEFGLNIEVEVFGPIIIRGEAQQYVGLGSKDFDRLQKDRRSYKVGFALLF